MKDVQKELYKEILTKGLPISSYLQSVGIDKGQFYKWMKGVAPELGSWRQVTED